jgi:hypothetical protein
LRLFTKGKFKMATTTLVHVTKCDNELRITAVPTGGLGSLEMLHMTSGFNNPVEYKVIPQSVLPPGSYILVMEGTNWGGPSVFTVSLTTGGVTTPITFGAGLPAGGVATHEAPITV